MTATFIKPTYRLAKVLDEVGGKTVADAIVDASAGVAKLSGECAAFVEAALGRIDAAYAALPDDFSPAALWRLYHAAGEVIGVAATAGLPATDRVAFQLCDLIDRMVARGAFDREPIAVHVAALRLVRTREASGERVGLTPLLAGLQSVRDRYAAANGA